jgi:hypothetical protein
MAIKEVSFKEFLYFSTIYFKKNLREDKGIQLLI